MRIVVQWLCIIGIVLGSSCVYGNPYYMTNPSDIDVTYAHNAAEDASRSAWDLQVARDRVSITDNPQLYMDMYVREQQYKNEAIRHRQNAQQMEETMRWERETRSMPVFPSTFVPVQKSAKTRRVPAKRNIRTSKNAEYQARVNEFKRMQREARDRARREHKEKVKAAFDNRWSVEAALARKKARPKPKKKTQKELVAEALATLELPVPQADSSSAR